MRFAILGAGLSGLAVTWYLLHYTQGTATIDLFDPLPIGGGASGLSSGLLHPYGGRQARRSWKGTRCMHETHRLITEASRTLGKPLVISKGILRPALTDQQISDFQLSAQTYPGLEWWDKKACLAKIPDLRLPDHGGGLYIHEGITLDVNSYLEGLWQACALLGTQHYNEEITSIDELEEYDRVLVAMGPMSKSYLPLKDLPITPVKGQVLDLEWPLYTKPLPFSVIADKYIVMRPDQRSCVVGATFEHTDTPGIDRVKAAEEILPKVTAFFPPLHQAPILDCRAAFRASSYNRLPLVGRVSEREYFFTGLGSKGLLYHAWVGKRVARTLLSGNLNHLPPEIHYVFPKTP